MSDPVIRQADGPFEAEGSRSVPRRRFLGGVGGLVAALSVPGCVSRAAREMAEGGVGGALYAYVGCYSTPDRDGNGEGINVYRVDPASGRWSHVQLVAGLENPSFLALDRRQRFLYSVHYEVFSVGSLDFIILHLEFDTSPDSAVLAWADELLKEHNTRRAIVVTHFMVGTGNPADFGAQGQAIYDELKGNPNLFLLLGGHVPFDGGEGRRVDSFDGQTVYSLLSDYQARSRGGDGWLRIMRFSPARNEIAVQTFSPYVDEGRGAFETDESSQFVLNYDMSR